MYSTTAYLYQQITKVLLIDTSGGNFTMRYNSVYSSKLTVAKGVDNVLLFEFINQDQKPVNITGSTFVFRLLNQPGTAVLAAKDMVVLSATLGRVKVTLTDDELNSIIAQPGSYSITKTSAGLTTPVFTNAQSSARAQVDIVDSVLPQFVASTELTIPSVRASSQPSYDGTGLSSYAAAQYPGFRGSAQSNGTGNATQEYYTSHITPVGPMTTVQMDLVHYTGTIKAQGAADYESLWYNVTDSTTYLNQTGTVYLNITGWHPLLRLVFNNSLFSTPDQPPRLASATPTVVDGVITGITITDSGTGYIAAPNIDIIGEGSGATAEATISNGSVATITVINGGTGYWPAPPTLTTAYISINTGFVENIIFR